MKYNIYKKSNVIPTGVLHKEKNDLPASFKLGTKGIPIVSCDINTKVCAKAAEVEKEELIIHSELSKEVERLATLYLSSKDPRIALDLGKLMYNQINNNTQDYSGKYK